MMEPKEAKIEIGEILGYSTNFAIFKKISYFGHPIWNAEFTRNRSKLFVVHLSERYL